MRVRQTARVIVCGCLRQHGPVRPSPILSSPACLRLRTLADVVAFAAAEGVELRLDGTETQVRRPRAHHAGRRAFVSGKKQQNTIKVTTVCDRRGRTLWAGAVRPGRMHDQTAIKTEGIEELLWRYDAVHATVDAGYRGSGQGVFWSGPRAADQAGQGRATRGA